VSAWTDELQQASWRGVPFGVKAEELRAGRRNAEHEYPFRDKPWIEDLGRKGRGFTLTGFLVADSLAYGGGDVFAQHDAMLAAIEQQGPGTLIVPTMGAQTVQLDACTITAKLETQGVFELQFTFLESGQQTFPSTSSDTGSAVAGLADAADAAVGGDFASAITGALGSGQAVVAAIGGTVSAFVGQAEAIAGDATSLLNEVSNLAGNFGRFANGANIGGLSLTQNIVSGEVGALIQVASGARAAVAGAGDAAEAAAGAISLDPTGGAALAGAVQSTVAAVSAAAVNPADAIRTLTPLAGFTGS
jgi:prophage DNA circulation protein